MHRFLFEPRNLTGDRVYLDREESQHLSKVLRLRAGDTVLAFDGQGNEYEAVVAEITGDKVCLESLRPTGASREAPIRLWLLQGVAKGEKMDLVIQKATELGVEKILPVLTERSVVRLDAAKAKERRDRWQKIAREAAKQCQRTVIPEVQLPVAWSEVITGWDMTTPLLIPWEEERGMGLKQVLSVLREDGLLHGSPSQVIGLAIGPEGGLTAAEAALARDRGAQTVGLGPRILRTETAGIAALAAIMYELGDWG
ncbi:16S rRNA (uracil(1498)-N(3))-methyltransferase [Heliobacterium undosum]|uniref:Ribosomal RNA small subunit methyltransferase E n=1 Tax=Heliomicrobium undosum TaxID=121734 RepID=A0A845KZW7_9FIRM|nr:16S rRNA (uracil(1498)-N(3))-methyltransferase [Heliomicrobium undosum]MZP28806.1 16S rRNA (uracil(1498)-N(3))-methyltransferase [Heliomicrobium undosum]